MSEMNRVKGKLIKLSEEEKQLVIQDLADNNGLSCEDILDDFDYYCEKLDRNYTFITDRETLFEIVDFQEDRNPSDCISTVHYNCDDSFDFDVYWYNCCGWEEVISSDLKEMLDNPPEETVTIPREEYEYLQKLLQAVECLPICADELVQSVK